ncbi:hypothetical protein P7K49_025302 [Saguinus oedipus]|uniref:Uncharacterized protein n=1 Tax=Saguinus oedipus TaxID=9490 RepID=A0ABQ9UGQ7_SAGOE|nr:hypothetical protein P7K49_025302 [Saguinus oedipus]
MGDKKGNKPRRIAMEKKAITDSSWKETPSIGQEATEDCDCSCEWSFKIASISYWELFPATEGGEDKHSVRSS